MLVLSRKKNESIVINDDITVVVVEIRGDKVRLGVECPPDVPVHRREVYDAIRREELSGQRLDPADASSKWDDSFRLLREKVKMLTFRTRDASKDAVSLRATVEQIHGPGSEEAAQLDEIIAGLQLVLESCQQLPVRP